MWVAINRAKTGKYQVEAALIKPGTDPVRSLRDFSVIAEPSGPTETPVTRKVFRHSRRTVKGCEADADRYRDIVDKLFSHVTVEYETCQIPWEQDRRMALDSLKWLRDHGKYVHGCHIIWPDIKDGLSKDIVSAKARPDEVRHRVMAHVDDKLAACKGLVQEWNALNELYTNRFLQDALGDDAGKAFVVDIFRRARQLDPSLRLDINDYGDMANPSQSHIDGYIAWVQYLKDHGAPVDVVGLQCHFGQFLRSPDDCLAMLDRFAAFGYPLHVTELDINMPDEVAQADYMRDIMTVLYSHPAVEKITLWGFWEGCHWLPKAALWRTDWSIKASGQAWMDLVFKQWRTSATLKTDGKGTAGLRAFLGDYEVAATRNGRAIAQKVSVTRNGASVELKLPATNAIGPRNEADLRSYYEALSYEVLPWNRWS
jgi:GH35 family endo-1,4-beta-xylanase